MRVIDVQAAGLCLFGMRRWARGHGINFNDAIRNGVDAAVIRRLAEKDHYARQVWEAYQRRIGGDGS